jgi:hypothetical protein
VSALALLPFALGETWWGVLGGLIPIIGLVLIGLVIWRAAQPPEQPKPPAGPDEDEETPT